MESASAPQWRHFHRGLDMLKCKGTSTKKAGCLLAGNQCRHASRIDYTYHTEVHTVKAFSGGPNLDTSSDKFTKMNKTLFPVYSELVDAFA